MVKITFVYMENKYNMAIENNEILISDAFMNYVSILNKNINELYFIHNGKYLSIDNNKKIIDFKKKNIIYLFLNQRIIKLKKMKIEN